MQTTKLKTRIVKSSKKNFFDQTRFENFLYHEHHQSFLGHMYATANNGWELSLFFALCTIIRIVARCIGNPPWESLTPDFICCCQCKLIPSSVINELKSGFSFTKKHLLGWLTFYRLGWDIKNSKSTFWTILSFKKVKVSKNSKFQKKSKVSKNSKCEYR